MSSRPRTILLRFVFPTICASLGTWQVFRWRQKLKLLQVIESQQSAAPKTINCTAEINSDTMKYSVSGLKSTGKLVLVGPRGNSCVPGGYASLLFEGAQLSNG
jgi:cytochrome oxidase assembly protein ShyY1